IAIAVADRSRVGPETNVYVGIARARTCEQTTISMIDGRPCVLEGIARARTHVRTDNDHYDRWSSMCIGVQMFQVIFGSRLERLELD
ncbi:unnamed protein product, partial [Heterotrigona itama]